jgi:BA14K-like protein
MKQMILARGMGAALALAVMAGFAGQASADLRQYCDSYARDVASRKTNGGADAGAIGGAGKSAVTGGAGGTILGAGVTGGRYKRAYANAYERCVANYQGTQEPDATAQDEAAAQKVTAKTEQKVTDKTGQTATAVATAPTEKKVAPSEPTEKKVAANEATRKKVAANEAIDRDKACARKYRSYDPQVGKYKSYGGKWRPCRLSPSG